MFVTEILRDALVKVEAYERDNPADARSIQRALEAFKFQISAMIQYIEQPSAMDLEDMVDLQDQPEDLEAEPVTPSRTRH